MNSLDQDQRKQIKEFLLNLKLTRNKYCIGVDLYIVQRYIEHEEILTENTITTDELNEKIAQELN